MIKSLISVILILMVVILGVLLLQVPVDSKIKSEGQIYSSLDNQNMLSSCDKDENLCGIKKSETYEYEVDSDSGCNLLAEKCKGIEQIKTISCYDILNQETKESCMKMLNQEKGCYKIITTRCGEKYIVKRESCLKELENQRKNPEFKQLEQTEKVSCYRMYDSKRTAIPCIN